MFTDQLSGSKAFGLNLQSYGVLSLLEAEKEEQVWSQKPFWSGCNLECVFWYGKLLCSYHKKCRAVLWEWCEEYAPACLTFYGFTWEKAVSGERQNHTDFICQWPTELWSICVAPFLGWGHPCASTVCCPPTKKGEGDFCALSYGKSRIQVL